MKISCYVIDDHEHSIALLKKYIEKTPSLEFVGSNTKPLEALELFKSQKLKAALTFMDIDMPGISGMELNLLLKDHTETIFITAHSGYAVQSYEHNILDYLLKPFSYERFLASIDKAINKFAHSSEKVVDKDKFFFVPGDRKGKLTKVNKEDVIYIEAARNYLILHLNDGQVITYLTLAEFESAIAFDSYVRIHRSFIVNMNKIRSKDNNILYLEDNLKVTVGRSYQKSIEDKLNNLIISSNRKTNRP